MGSGARRRRRGRTKDEASGEEEGAMTRKTAKKAPAKSTGLLGSPRFREPSRTTSPALPPPSSLTFRTATGRKTNTRLGRGFSE